MYGLYSRAAYDGARTVYIYFVVISTPTFWYSLQFFRIGKYLLLKKDIKIEFVRDKSIVLTIAQLHIMVSSRCSRRQFFLRNGTSIKDAQC